jgi:benzoylformate decarboxylase
MRELVHGYLNHSISRRAFLGGMAALGFTASAATSILAPLNALEAPTENPVANMTMLQGTGGELMVAQAKAAGVEYLFSNPGSLEVGFYDAIADDPQIHFVMGLHEGTVVSMADGYHRVSLKPAFVNVHTAVGTAQMAGQLYNASCDGSAMVLTAGMRDNEAWSDDVSLGARPGFNQKEINRQFTKISWESRQADSLPLMIRRAFKVAATEPGGPVYLAMSRSALESTTAKAVAILPGDRFMIRTRVHADKSEIERCARMLIEAKRPILIVSDEVWKSSAQQELLSLSERLGLPVAVRDFGRASGRELESYASFPTRHPHYLGAFRVNSVYAKRGIDLVFFIGSSDAGRDVIPTVPELPAKAQIVRLGIDTSSLGRNYPTDVALVSDVKAGLTDIFAAVDSLLTQQRQAAIAKARSQEIEEITTAQHMAIEKEILASLGRSPIHPYELGQVMARTIDRNAIVVSENLTGKYDSFAFGFRENEQMYLSNTGACLGWGIGAATGAKLAAPDRQVICSIGDGSVMYCASGFWTQARYRIPVLTIVWNNRNYQTVRHSFYAYQGRMASSGRYPGMYLGDPDIDFVQLAASQGVGGERVEKGSQIEAALKRGMAANRDGKPYLVEVVVACYGGGADSTWHEKFSLAERGKQRT